MPANSCAWLSAVVGRWVEIAVASALWEQGAPRGSALAAGPSSSGPHRAIMPSAVHRYPVGAPWTMSKPG